MEVITFSPDMDLSSKEAGDVFRLKLYGIEYDVKVVGDDEKPVMSCKDCIFYNNDGRCLLSESQDWCIEKEVVYCTGMGERLYEYGVNNIKVISVGHPKDHNYGTDWMDVRVEFCDEWRQKMLSNIGKIANDDKCKKYAEANYRSVSGYIFLGPEDLKEFEKEIIERKSDSEYDVTILLNMYLTLAFVKEFGFKAGEAWSEITEYAYGCLSYSDFATTEMLIPEGSEHLFKDIYTAKADELYHHVLDKFGWAWRDPKYKSETELCAMLKWAKEKGLTIEELSI